MRRVFLLIAAVSLSFASNSFVLNSECKKCHETIYKEFMSAQHANSTIFKDKIHAAVWAKHPKNKKMKKYGCAKCHTPAANDIDKLSKKGAAYLPDKNNPTQNDGISCAYCHRIESIKHGKMLNTNIISKEPKKYFGNLQDHIKSPFHKIDTSNKNFKNGNVCIGCHSHKKNKFNLNVCSTNIKNELDKANCVSCHMPKVKGSVSNLRETKTHAFHGFPGLHIHSNMLSKYVDIELLREIDDFWISINNKSSHALTLHPLRVMKLEVSVKRGGKVIKLPSKIFLRALGRDGKPTPPWLATEIIKNTSIKANEKRSIKYNFHLQKGDEVKAVLGYYLVNPKLIKKLGLENDEKAKKFHILKEESFKI